MTIRVLIAEPDEPLLESYHDCLSRQGFEIATATTGPECVGLLCEFAPDVLVLEPDLPDGWGNKLLGLMRDDPRVPCVPVVVVTRRDHEVSEYPIREYYVNPFSMSRLASAIRTAAEESPLKTHQ